MNTAKNPIVRLSNYEFIILEQEKNCSMLLLKDFWQKRKFDNYSNNYAQSKIREDLKVEFLLELEKLVGPENIVPMEIDLTSENGHNDYGKVIDKVGLLTGRQYRKYSHIIEKFPVDDWWWLAIPTSTKQHGYYNAVCCVSNTHNDDELFYFNTCNNVLGIRPTCKIKFH